MYVFFYRWFKLTSVNKHIAWILAVKVCDLFWKISYDFYYNLYNTINDSYVVYYADIINLI